MFSRYGLVGEALSHSYSPEIHRDLMKKHDLVGTYDLIEIPREHFTEDFKAVLQRGYNGLNVTIPYKETVIPFLDGLSPEARYIGAVNTLSFKEGKITGHNTDYYGFLTLMSENQVSIKGKTAVILGSGGAAKAVIKALLDSGISDITVLSTSKEKFHAFHTISYDFFAGNAVACDLLINCTPVGMYPNSDHCPIPKHAFRAKIAVDLIYNPADTLFLKVARSMGLKTIGGIRMLTAQAEKSQEIWRQTT